MNLFWWGCLTAVGIAATEVPAGTELQYSGTLSQQSKPNGVTSEDKSFSVSILMLAGDGNQSQIAWSLEERGSGGWAWPERFGAIIVGPAPADKQPSPGLRLLHTHDGIAHPIGLRPPVFEFQDKLATDATWSNGRLEYRVARKRKFKDRDCWEVEVHSNTGRSQTLLVDAGSGVLVSVDQRVFMGRGDEFQLKMELLSQRRLAPADLAKSESTFESLRRLQVAVGRTGDQKIAELSPEQLKTAQEMIGPIEQRAQGTIWEKLTGVIARDLVQQQRRLEGAAGLSKKFVGQPAPKLSLKLPDGSTIPTADLQGKVVVLHFWEYRHENLMEPYGQIGYLDFLNGKRKKLGAKVIGVNVDPRFADRENSGAAVRSMKKLQEFMNLTYDVAVDDGSLLAQFGDPRALGSPLPLWVVIGHDGKISHYHIGFYNITPDEGLKDLDQAVIDALRKQRDDK